MTTRLASLFVTVCLCSPVEGQQAPPQLSRQQRELLLALVTAVDSGAAANTDAGAWQLHRMRAADGSHYIAFSARPPASAPLPPGPVVVYVRLATVAAPGSFSVRAERSQLREWLTGNLKTPPPTARNTILIGEMPTLGAAGNISRRPPNTPGMNDLQAIDLDRRRAREKEEERERQRRAELEGKAVAIAEVMPFEDFDFASHSLSTDGARIIARALTAGPGDYELSVGWADPLASNPAGTIRVMRTPLRLPPASATELGISSVILADRVGVRAAPHPPTAQAAFPYSFGVTEIVPAPDNDYTRDDRLAVAFQIINPRPADTGKPDLAVTFRIVRVAGERETPVASLKPQYYGAATLPPDFDLRLGHPVFAAVSAPLATLGRGEYRLKIAVEDRISGSRTATDADFRIIATPASLLAEAPPLAPPFAREPVLGTGTVAALIEALTPRDPSPALLRALTTARGGKLLDLLAEEPVPAPERGVRTALTALALLTAGDASAAVQFQRALQENAPAGPVQFLLGVARAAQARDGDAIAAWQAALASQQAPPITAQLLAEAYLRRGEPQRAVDTLLSDPARGAGATRVLAAAQIAAGRPRDAVAALHALPPRDAGDAASQWLLLHALYAQFVGGDRAVAPRLRAEGQRYFELKGAHSALLADWLKLLAP